MTDKTNIFQALIKRDPDFLDLPLSMKEKESRLRDGQDAGKALLMIEARIGDLLPKPEEARRIGGIEGGLISQGKLKRSSARPAGISEKQAIHARAIAHHPAEVAEVIKEAEENEDIPTKTAVLNKIAYKQEAARKKGNLEATQLEMSFDCSPDTIRRKLRILRKEGKSILPTPEGIIDAEKVKDEDRAKLIKDTGTWLGQMLTIIIEIGKVSHRPLLKANKLLESKEDRKHIRETLLMLTRAIDVIDVDHQLEE
jgi:hypothetical protein